MHEGSRKSEQASRRPAMFVYALGFLLGLHMALPAYIHSTFLSSFFPEKYVGIIFSAAALLSIWVFTKLPHFLKRFGDFKITLVFLILALVSTAALAVLDTGVAVLAAFLLSYISAVVLIFNFDVFLEHSSSNRTTGEMRGTYLVFVNIAWVIAQLSASFILKDNDYSWIFLASAFISTLMLLLVFVGFRNFKDSRYRELSVFKLFVSVRRHKGIVSAFIANFLLQFFFVWMIIYMPLYLHNHIGFDWRDIAIMFSVMLIPFVVVERPLGVIADKILGEKELLVAGFVIMALTSGSMAFITSPNLLLWTALLFVSRIGAATTEIMSETYFFKQIADRDASLIGFFRTARPWAYIVAPIVATAFLPFIGIQYLFLTLGLIMAYGAVRSLALKDTL